MIRKRMAESECGLVYNNDTFNWNSDEYEPCNATTSILTRFGCCPNLMRTTVHDKGREVVDGNFVLAEDM